MSVELSESLLHLNYILNNEKNSSYENSLDLVYGSFETYKNTLYKNLESIHGAIDLYFKLHGKVYEIIDNINYSYNEDDMDDVKYYKGKLYNYESKIDEAFFHMSKFNHFSEKKIIDTPKKMIEELIKKADELDIDTTKEKLLNDMIFIQLRQKLKILNTIFKEQNTILGALSNVNTVMYNETDSKLFDDIFLAIKDTTLSEDLVSNNHNIKSADNLVNFLELKENYEKLYTNIVEELIAKIRIKKEETNKITRYSDIQIANKDENLKSYILDKCIIGELSFSQSQSISELKLYSDYSLTYRSKDNNNELATTLKHDEAANVIRQACSSCVEYLLRKKPGYIPVFKEKLIEEQYDMRKVASVINSFIENEQILKNILKDKFEHFIKNHLYRRSLEAFDDNMMSLVNDYKSKQYAHSIASVKYRELYDNRSYEVIKELYDQKVPKDMLQNYIGKKIAAFKTPSDFNNALTMFLSSINGFNYDAVMIKKERLNAHLVSFEDNQLILKIDNYVQSKALGSASWCIVRNESYFNDYVTDMNSNQYFVYDFNKDSTHPESMIGITILKDGEFYAAHDKTDDSINRKDIPDLLFKIVEKNLESYNITTEQLPLYKKTKLGLNL